MFHLLSKVKKVASCKPLSEIFNLCQALLFSSSYHNIATSNTSSERLFNAVDMGGFSHKLCGVHTKVTE